MKRVRVLVLATLIAAFAGCTRTRLPFKSDPQWTVHLRSNARIPEMADRIRIDVLDEQGELACGDCSNDFDLTSTAIIPSVANPLVPSFGVAGTDNAVRLRVRLYTAIRGGIETSPRSIDVVARLPKREANWPGGETEVDFALPFGCFGQPPSIANKTTCQAAGQDVINGPEPTLSTTVVALEEGSCSKEAPAGMACVGFGSFLLGDERVDALASDFPPRPEVIPIRFRPNGSLFIDIEEMTVGTVRKLLGEKKITAASGALLTRGNEGTSTEFCTFLGDADDRNDKFPINCISRDLAADVCKARGARLPSEAEWEFAAGNATAETVYPFRPADLNGAFFGLEDEFTICSSAVVGRGRRGRSGESGDCIFLADVNPGPAPRGHPDDVTQAGVMNMAGNVSEWVSDEFAFYEEHCIEAMTHQPCKRASQRLEGKWVPYRGGSWEKPVQSTIAVARFVMKDGAPSASIGFRCAISEDELP